MFKSALTSPLAIALPVSLAVSLIGASPALAHVGTVAHVHEVHTISVFMGLVLIGIGSCAALLVRARSK